MSFSIKKTIFRPGFLGGVLLLFCLQPEAAAGADAGTVDNDLNGKVIVGYQGWFGTPGDGTGGGWRHYSRSGTEFTRKTTTFEMWPDMTEAGPDERQPTDFRLKDGSTAFVFSSANAATVNRHFQWMRDYGIAGAALQRFGGDVRSPDSRAFRNRILENCRVAAAANGRIWYVMYDLSGLDDRDVTELIEGDWKSLLDASDFRKEANYARYNGKPVVCLWGIGFNDGRKYSLAACAKLVDFLKHDAAYGGNSVILGTPYYWRETPPGHGPDAVPFAELESLVSQADVISPWAVGRYGNLDDAAKIGERNVGPDLAWCRAKGIGYQPVLFAGFRWNNLMRTRGQPESAGIPRQGGKFLRAQAASAIGAGASMIYIAMFDEVDEGTAIFKVTNDAPVPEGSFLTYEGLPSDFYLRLAGEIGAVLSADPKVRRPFLGQ